MAHSVGQDKEKQPTDGQVVKQFILTESNKQKIP